MAQVVGIDLGTSFSLVAACSPTKEHVIDLLANAEGEKLTPSVIEIEKPTRASGTLKEHVGVSLALTDLINNEVLYRFKRSMGTDKKYIVEETQYTPVALSSMILRKLKQDAEAKVGDTIDHAVISVPANFTSEARRQTRQAAEDAGLTVLDLISEPTAAALYMSYRQERDISGNCCVVDLGGGTLDVSVLTIANQEIRVLASEGDNNLGGYDFDDCLKRLIRERAQEEWSNPLEEGRPEPGDLESIKKALGRLARKTYVYGPEEMMIRREEFEAALAGFLDKIRRKCLKALEEAGMAANEIAEVVLVGGSVRVPAVKRVVEEIFSNANCRIDSHCDTAVASGAGLYAAILADRTDLMKFNQEVLERIRGFDLGEVSHKHYGLVCKRRQPGGGTKYTPINRNFISRGEALPVINRTREFITSHANQTIMTFKITESPDATGDVDHVKIIQDHTLPLPKKRSAGRKVRVRYDMGYDQILRCHFVDVESGMSGKVEFQAQSKPDRRNRRVESYFPAVDQQSELVERVRIEPGVSDLYARLKSSIVEEVGKANFSKAQELADKGLRHILSDQSITLEIRRAQNEVLNNIVDSWRVKMIRKYHKSWILPDPVLPGQGGSEKVLEQLEIIDLRNQARKRPVREQIAVIDKQRIDWLLKVRNILSHPSLGVVDWGLLGNSHGICNFG